MQIITDEMLERIRNYKNAKKYSEYELCKYISSVTKMRLQKVEKIISGEINNISNDEFDKLERIIYTYERSERQKALTKRILKLRKELNLDQAIFSKMLGTSSYVLSNLENNSLKWVLSDKYYKKLEENLAVIESNKNSLDIVNR